ncbi:MAG: Asp-tRNA(Asn)/Glu-tRNA(Gln) amidotransferase subunit GatA [Candidatus Saccharibacteria bacterium]|nr:Asp-tRNA(Asn)/Glu-tRNA(Gln) amidotransferase subunit GatA [Candidatus Saccharibacteria bacterium]
MNSKWLPINEIAEKVNNGSLRAADLVDQALKTIEQNTEYNAIIVTTADRARERASQIDKLIKSGSNAGMLAGVPFIAKDNFLVFGSETTAASNILKGFNAPYQATVIEKLEAAGAICVAKANLDAFGHGGSTENSDFGPTLNPHDKTKVPGGSSGGSAAAVVLDMAPFALGTDTGGSSRQPASFSGCVGYKPTYGLMSRSGVIAMASSTDTVGVLGRGVSDVAYVTECISGKDPLDSTTIESDPAGYIIDKPIKDLKGIKIGLVSEYMTDGVDEGVKNSIKDTAKKLESLGAEVIPVSIPSLSLALAVYYILVPAEISSNLSRYDGQRFGYSDPNAKDLDESYTNSRTRGFGKEAKRRIMIGTHVLSSGYYEAYYKKAQLVRTKIIKEVQKTFQSVDYLIGPAAPTTAFELGSSTQDPLQMYLADIMTVGASLTGIPAIVIPAGNISGMPVGLQIMSPQKSDKSLLEVAQLAQKEINK